MSEAAAPPPPESLSVDVSAMRRRGETHGRVEADLSSEWLAHALSDTDAEVREAGRVAFDLNLPGDGPVIVSGQLAVTFIVPCGRCLEDAVVDGNSRIDAMFVLSGTPVARQEEDEDGLALDDEALDSWPYDGRTIDLARVVTEYVKVAYPMRALCEKGEACEGLCSGCGNNFNEVPPRIAGNRAFCVKCGQEFLGAVGDPPTEAESDSDAEEPPKSTALADALRKLQLPD
ncbi:MAG: YceD family protein [Nannocystales bacterium]